MTNDEREGEGENWTAAFVDKVKFGSLQATQARLEAERRAGRTPKQRARKATRTIQMNFRAEPALKALADGLAAKLDCSVASVIDRAVRELAEREGVAP